MALRLEAPPNMRIVCLLFSMLMPELCSHFNSDLPVCPFFANVFRWIPRIRFLTSVSILPCDPARCHFPVYQSFLFTVCTSMSSPSSHAVPLIPPLLPSCMCDAWCVVGWWWFCLGVLKRVEPPHLEPKCHCLSRNKCLTFVFCGMCLFVCVIMDVSMCIGQSFLSAL